jgi:hypothetical protein
LHPRDDMPERIEPLTKVWHGIHSALIENPDHDIGKAE